MVSRIRKTPTKKLPFLLLNLFQYNTAVKKHSNCLCRFVEKMTYDQDLAKDLVQDAFLKLWDNRAKVELEKSKSWLFTTVYRLTLHWIRDNKKTINQLDFIHQSYEMDNPDLQKILAGSLVLLSETQRSIVLLKDYEGYNYKEIGEILELSESQVKVYLFRARQKLREYIVDLKLVL
jgi:RNA polymerase sigma factor (sigma-70 family)